MSSRGGKGGKVSDLEEFLGPKNKQLSSFKVPSSLFFHLLLSVSSSFSFLNSFKQLVQLLLIICTHNSKKKVNLL